MLTLFLSNTPVIALLAGNSHAGGFLAARLVRCFLPASSCLLLTALLTDVGQIVAEAQPSE